MNRVSKSEIQKAPFLNQVRIAEDLGNLLVLSPHPDDETLGCGGLISMLKSSGKKVIVIFITSGSASHTSHTHPPNELAKLRENEAKAACSKLGVLNEDVYFIGAKDSELNTLDSGELNEIVIKITHILEGIKIDTIAIPWRRDPHPDHIVTYTIGELFSISQDSKMVKLEYPIWLWKNGNEEDYPFEQEVAPFRLDITRYIEQKSVALQMHQSQLGNIIHDDPNGFVLTKDMLEPFSGPYEYYFIDNKSALKTLDEVYFQKLYSEQSDPWNFRNSTYEHEKYHNSIKALNKTDFKNGLELGCSVGIQTKLLAAICEHLTAIDINEIAVKEARSTCTDLSNISFYVQDVTKIFPKGKFDLITLCEIGYYFDIKNLWQIFENISMSLLPEGRLLLVHWTGFVPDYPLNGNAVHSAFEEYIKRSNNYVEMVAERTDFYRLQIWKKLN